MIFKEINRKIEEKVYKTHRIIFRKDATDSKVLCYHGNRPPSKKNPGK